MFWRKGKLLMQRLSVHSPDAPVPAGPYAHAIKAGGFVYVSGQVGIDPATGQLVAGLEAQARQALLNLQTILQEAGSSLADVVKTTIFITDIAAFLQVNAVYGEIMGDSPPARSTIGVSALPLQALIEIEVIALDPATH